MIMNFEYIAGFFDAEGSVYFKDRTFKDGYTRKVISLQFINTNEFLLKEIQKFLNAGYTYERKFKGNHFGKKPIYAFYVYKKEDVIRIAKELLNFSLIKREKLIELFNYLGISYEETEPKITYPYIAGLIDGDGSILKNKEGIWAILISSKNKKFLEKIKDFIIKHTPNYVGIRKKAEVYNDKENLFTLHIKNQKIVEYLLKKLESYLIIKKDIAKEAIESLKFRKNYRFINFTKEQLKQMLNDYYINQKLSIRQIAKKFNVRYSTIQGWLVKLNIPRREAKAPESIIIPKEELIRLYVEEKKSACEIAKIYGTSHSTILEKLRKYGIEIRPNKKLVNVENLKEMLENMYLKRELSISQIAKEFGVTKEAIWRWMNKFNIPRRSLLEAAKNKIY